jgi:hypothetical protein
MNYTSVRLGFVVAVGVLSFTSAVDAATKAKRPNLASLQAVSGCVNSLNPPWCKRLGSYVLRDANALNGPVPANGYVTVWGSRGADITLCWAPAFDVVYWRRGNKICTQ